MSVKRSSVQIVGRAVRVTVSLGGKTIDERCLLPDDEISALATFAELLDRVECQTYMVALGRLVR